MEEQGREALREEKVSVAIEQLKEIRARLSVCKNRNRVRAENLQQLREVTEDIIKHKQGKVAMYEGAVEFFDMMIVNGINLLEEMDFAHKKPILTGDTRYKYLDYGKQGVRDLIEYFNGFFGAGNKH